MDTLWTGFEPFGDHGYNPSGDVARGAAETAGDDTSSAILPVRYEAAREWVREVARSDPSARLIHVGLAASRETVCLERRATHTVGDRPDEAGEQPDALQIDASLEEGEALETTLPVEQFADDLDARLRSDGLPGARTSDDAGDYVCNAVYLHALAAARRVRRAEGELRTLFVHVTPCEPKQARRIGRHLHEVLDALEIGPSA